MGINSNKGGEGDINVPIIDGATDIMVAQMAMDTDDMFLEAAFKSGYTATARIMNSSTGRRSGLVGGYINADQLQDIMKNGLDIDNNPAISFRNYPDNPVDSEGKKFSYFILYRAGIKGKLEILV